MTISKVTVIENSIFSLIVIKLILYLAEYLASRSWKGLEQKQGETPITKVVQGREGIAAVYSHEKGLNKNHQESPSSE